MSAGHFTGEAFHYKDTKGTKKSLCALCAFVVKRFTALAKAYVVSIFATVEAVLVQWICVNSCEPSSLAIF